MKSLLTSLSNRAQYQADRQAYMGLIQDRDTVGEVAQSLFFVVFTMSK